MTIGQLRAARALIGWTQDEVAALAAISVQTIKRMESVGPERSSAGNVMAVQRALEAAGVQFIPENGAGAGVRFRRFRVGDVLRIRPGGTLEFAKAEKRRETVLVIDAQDLPANGFRVAVRFPDGEETALVDANQFVFASSLKA